MGDMRWISAAVKNEFIQVGYMIGVIVCQIEFYCLLYGLELLV